MNELACYEKLYPGTSNLVPHYRNRFWQHVCLVVKNGLIKTFLNGKEKSLEDLKEFSISFFR